MRYWKMLLATMCLAAASGCGGSDWSFNTTSVNVDPNTSRLTPDSMPIQPDVVTGSGVYVTESRVASGRFSEVSVEGPFDVEIETGAFKTIDVHADDNLFDRIETHVVDGRLVIRAVGSFRTGQTPRVRFASDRVQTLEVRGSGDVRLHGRTGDLLRIRIAGSGDVVADADVRRIDVRIEGSADVELNPVKADRIELVVIGSGDILVRGQTRELDAEINGSGDIEAGGLDAEAVRVAIKGSGDALVSASKSLDASVHGSGDVIYAGSPENVNAESYGSGDIERR